jgi:hydrogenase maturation protease
MRVCVMGIGNELREDDGVGLVVLRELKRVLPNQSIVWREIGDRLFDIPEIMKNFDTVLIIDAVPPGSGSGPIETFYYDGNYQPVRENYSLHDLDVFWQLAYARSKGFYGEVILIGITIYCLGYRMGLSAELVQSLPEIILIIAGIIEQILIGAMKYPSVFEGYFIC